MPDGCPPNPASLPLCANTPRRYDVSVCPTKVVPGSMGFVAQLNVGRATQKRATEFKLDQVGVGACPKGATQ